MQITSRISEHRPQFEIVGWEEAGLKKPSYIRYANLHHIHISHVAKSIGNLNENEYNRMIEIFNEFVRISKGR